MASIEDCNTELMQTLADAKVSQDWETFEARHKPDVMVQWPGKPQVGNRPYRVFSASGDRTCSISRFTGPMTGPNGTEIPPTGRSFAVDCFTVAKWDNGQIVEENLVCDLVGFMQQIGLGG